MINFTNWIEQFNIYKGSEKTNVVLNTYSCLKENGKKIHHMTYIQNQQNKQCNEALLRIFPQIKIDEIKEFIENIEVLSLEGGR